MRITMKKIFSALIGLVILTSTAFSQKIPVEGWLGPGKAKESIECSESWKDSGKRTHYFVCKAPGEITLYGEGFGFKAKQEADWGLSIFDELINGRIVFRAIWTSFKDPSAQFKGHADCDLTSGSTTCVMWFKGYGEYEGKIMELTMNEKDAAETEEDDNPNLYMLEGIVMDEPTDD